jgi:NDP-sugar pyrophosphorylase family protein
MKPTLVVLAAGMGSRYGGLKQVDAFGRNGESILEYSLYDAIQAGFGKVVFIIRKAIEPDFRAKFDGKFDKFIKVAYVYQEIDSPVKGVRKFPQREKPLGTAHAMLMAAKAVKTPFAIINADDYYGPVAFRQIANFLRQDCRPDNYCMVGYMLKNTLSDNGTVARGVCSAQNGYLTDINERIKIDRSKEDNKIYYYEDDKATQLPEDTVVSMNFWGFHPSVFEHSRTQFIHFLKKNMNNPKSEFFIPLVAGQMLKDKSMQLRVLTCPDQWFGVTYTEDKEEVIAALIEKTDNALYPNDLWA